MTQRLEIATQLMAAHISHYGVPDDVEMFRMQCVHEADRLIKAEHEYPVTVIVEPETPGDVG